MRTCLVWEPKELLVTICVMCGVLKKNQKPFLIPICPIPPSRSSWACLVSRLLFVCSHQFELKLAQRSVIKVLLQTDPHFASMITSGDENWNLSQLPLVEKQGTPWAGRQHNTELTQRDTQHDIHIHT